MAVSSATSFAYHAGTSRLRARLLTDLRGLTISQIAQRYAPRWIPKATGGFFPWRGNASYQLLSDRVLYIPDTGEKFDAIDLLGILLGLGKGDAERRYCALSAIPYRRRKIAYGNAYEALLGYLYRRCDTSPIIKIDQGWADWSELSDKTRLRCVKKLREDNSHPFLALTLSHTFSSASGTSSTRWETIVVDLRDTRALNQLHSLQADSRDRHFRSSQRGADLSICEIKTLAADRLKAWRELFPKPPSPPEKQPAGDGHFGDNRGRSFSFEKPKADKQQARPQAKTHPLPRNHGPSAHGIPPTTLMRTIRALQRRLSFEHWDSCRVQFSPAHAYGFAKTAIQAGFAFEAARAAYSHALHRAHMQAVDAGRLSFSPSGVVTIAKRRLSGAQNARYVPHRLAAMDSPLPAGVKSREHLRSLIAASLAG